MTTIRFNRLHFFKPFDPSAEYVALRDLVIAGVPFKCGETIDKSLMPTHKIKALFNSRKITPDYSLYTQEGGTEEESSIQKLDPSFPVIVKAGPVWKKVMLGDEQIGKSVKTEEEAQAIIDEWLEEQTK